MLNHHLHHALAEANTFDLRERYWGLRRAARAPIRRPALAVRKSR
jgi:hypothetical protein